MKRLLILTICSFSLAGCVSVTQAERMLVATETATAVAFRLPLILKQETPTPTQPPYGLPDLTIWRGGAVYDDPCPWGSPGTIIGTVRNIGTNHAGPFVAVLNAQETSFNGLWAGASSTLESRFTSGPVGGIYAEVDTQYQVVESNEYNNISFITYTPPPPCDTPSVTPIRVPPTPMPTTPAPTPEN